jgi:hypothetical protein
MADDRIEELEALVRLAELLAEETADDAPPRLRALAQALAVRLKALADGVRLP